MELLQQPVELMPDALFMLTQNGSIGLSPLNEAARSIIDDLNTEDILKGFAEELNSKKELVDPFHLHLTACDYCVWMFRMHNDAGYPQTLLQVKAETKSEFDEPMIERLFETSPDCLKLLDADGKLQHMNANGCRLMEIEDLPGIKDKEWWTLWPADTRQTVKDSVNRARLGETSMFQAFCPTAKGTPKWWDVIVSPVVNQHKKVIQIISSSRDITHIKEHEQQLQENINRIKQEELRKIEFIKMISHELRTPVTSIGGYSQLLLDTIEENAELETEQLQYPLQRINAQVHRLGRLINNLLDVSRDNANTPDFKPELFSLAELIHHTVNDIRYINRGCNVEVKQTVPVMVNADKHKIEQILVNLLSNAIKFSYLGSEIEVTMNQPSLNKVEVCIKDNGIGINNSELNKIYERFYRVEQEEGVNYTGLGIGLFLVKQLTEQHGGSLRVTSEQGQGSTFCFTLPTATV